MTGEERIDRLDKLREFDKQLLKEMLEWGKKPWWVQQQEEGDYHYNDFDMEPKEEA